MKKFFTFALLAIAAMYANTASADIKPGKGVADVICTVGTTTDLSNIPVTLSLTNPETPITALEACIKAPVDVKDFVYDEDEEAYAYDQGSRWMKSHAVVLNAGTALHGADYFFISITSSSTQNFKQTSGAIITVYFDGSSLSDGDYVVKMKDAIAVWSDKTSIDTYTTEDTDVAFSISGGKCTAIESVTAEKLAKAKTIYGVDGVQVTAPVKGQIYIVDGEKVVY